MSAWGANAKSCKSLLDRVEQNDPTLTELFILPTKSFGAPEVERLSNLIETGNLQHLQKLSASGHKLPNESLYKLGIALAKAASNKMAAPTSLAIGDHTMGHTGILAFTKGLKEGGGMTDLQELDLSYKGIGSNALEMIIDCCNAEASPKLRILNLSRNEKIGEDQQQQQQQPTIVSERISMAALVHLEELDLSRCGLSPEFVWEFLLCLQPQSNGSNDGHHSIEPRLKKLHLQENTLKAMGFKATLPLLTQNNSSLEYLNLSKCHIGDDAIQFLPVSQDFNNHLQTLDLSHNEISASGAEHLANVLGNNGSLLSNLVELNLAGNTLLGDEGVQCLAKALASRYQQQQLDDDNDGPKKTLLKKLDLSNTNCGIQGATDIISLGKLQSLYLFNNNLGIDGFMALAPTLKGGHSTLENLDLGGNGANQASVVVLLNAFLEQPNGDDVDGEHNSDEKSSGNKLKVVVVGGNEGGDAVEQIIAKIQKVHPKLDIARDKQAQRQPSEAGEPIEN